MPATPFTSASHRDLDVQYSLNLSIQYATKLGESICVLGSIDELGNWKDHKCHLKWTEGHIWVTETPILTK